MFSKADFTACAAACACVWTVFVRLLIALCALLCMVFHPESSEVFILVAMPSTAVTTIGDPAVNPSLKAVLPAVPAVVSVF